MVKRWLSNEVFGNLQFDTLLSGNRLQGIRSPIPNVSPDVPHIVTSI